MGRRSANSTKSGKFMNPTDQARKEARRKELKKNKKQRTMVRAAVLKGKDPVRIIEELEQIDNIEFNTSTAPILNEKVLKEKRRKLNETFQRVIAMYEKDQPEQVPELKQSLLDYESRRFRMQTLYEQAKTAERVQLCEIPLPDMPQGLPLPGEIPLPSIEATGSGILKKKIFYAPPKIKRKLRRVLKDPPGPPPGTPPSLSDDEAVKEKGTRRIRFADDADPSNDLDGQGVEKDTRLTFKANVSSLQEKMLRIAGQNIPMIAADNSNKNDFTIKPPALDHISDSSLQIDPDMVLASSADVLADDESEDSDDSGDEAMPQIPLTAISMPPGPPPGAPPGVPPQVPFGRPAGPPPAMLAPPPGMHHMLGVPRPGFLVHPRPPMMPPQQQQSHQIHSGPAISMPIVPPPPTYSVRQMTAPADLRPKEIIAPAAIAKAGPTITAKPQLLTSGAGDVTKFMPTSLRIKRIVRDARGKPIRQSSMSLEPAFMDLKKMKPNALQTKDDAYDNFMKEMENIM